jgi:hypothetical protein
MISQYEGQDPLNQTGQEPTIGMQLLKCKGITSLRSLSNAIAADPDFITNEFPDPALGVRVAGLASDAELKSARRITRSNFRDHLADLCVGIAIMLVLYGVFRDRTPAKVPISPQVVISKVNGLSPFEVIKAEDVTLNGGTANSSVFTSEADVIGRYAIEYIAPATPIKRSMLNEGPKLSNELSQRRIVVLKLQPTALLATIHTPIKLDLLAAPRDKGLPTLLVHEIYILDLHSETTGISAVVALSATDFDKVAPRISNSDLFAIGPTH